MNPLLTQFITEAGDLVESADENLLKLERNPHDDDLINALFRAVHTIKGAAGLFDIPAFIRLVHAGEDLLVAARDHRLLLDPAVTDLLLEAMDRIRDWLAALGETERLPDDAFEIGRTLADKLRAFIPPENGPTSAIASDAPGPGSDQIGWLIRIGEEQLLAAFSAAVAENGGSLLAVSYVPDPQCFFNGEDPLHLVGMVPDILALHVGANGDWLPSDLIDPYTCNLVFTLVCRAARAEVEHLFRYVPDQVMIVPLSLDALILPRGRADGGPVVDDFAVTAARLCDRNDQAGLVQAAEALLGLIDPGLYTASIVRWITAVARVSAVAKPGLAGVLAELVRSLAEHRPFDVNRSRSGTMPGLPPSAVSHHHTGFVAPTVDPLFLRILQEQRNILGLPCASPELAGRIASVGRTVACLFASTGQDEALAEVAAASDSALLIRSVQPLAQTLDAMIAVHTPSVAPAAVEVLAAAIAEGVTREHGPTRTLRVDRSKIDLLMNLIGELVVAKNSLPFLARRAEEVHGSREMAREIKDQFAVVDRLAQEMQNAIMQVRMLPVAQMFQRFPRLVRDLARKLGKQVDLVLEGENTEADKNVIEGLGDPLVHLIRNSLDHGIEPSDERIAAGKPATGTIRLAACQEGDCVVIEISDDGRGIDPQHMKAKALEKRMVDVEKAATLTDDEAVQLIFMPGFSTAAAITDVSGRGVGMDVVRTAVEREGGRLTLNSRCGLGTTCRLYLPLSMAVTRVMMVETAGQLFGVPMEVIAETVRVPFTALRRIKAAETTVLRGSIIPVLRLRRLLGLPDDDRERDSEAVMVVRLSNQMVGVVIDQFREGIDIILKPLDGVVGNLSGYAGTAILGDGRILLVLNMREIL
ncbi:MAG: chemotaxis protein CheA [Alphaproteobacteria bacterium]|nr:chemotaxis protein CheA [Alphaproteobacteria bacterium]